MVGMHVGDDHGGDGSHRDLALGHPRRQRLPAVRVVPARIDHDEACVMLDQVAEHVMQRVADNRHWHGPDAPGDVLDRGEFGPVPRITLPGASYLHSAPSPFASPAVRGRARDTARRPRSRKRNVRIARLWVDMRSGPMLARSQGRSITDFSFSAWSHTGSCRPWTGRTKERLGDEELFPREGTGVAAANAPRRGSADDEAEARAGPGAVIAEQRAFQAKLYDAGFAGITWPTEYGGQGLTSAEQIAWSQESRDYDLPTGVFFIGLSMPGTRSWCRHRGAEEALPAADARGEEIWCQLFSEPGAGWTSPASRPAPSATATSG